MKKLLLLFVVFLFSAVFTFGQEVTKDPIKSRTQTRTQIQTNSQSGDPIMIRQRDRINDGQGPMTRVESRTIRREANQKNGTCANPKNPMVNPQQGKHLNAKSPMNGRGKMNGAPQRGRR